MRRLMIVTALLLVAGFVSDYFWVADYGRDYADVLRDEIAQARMETYTDPDYGYEVSYPSFFVRDPLVNDVGHARFRYADDYHTLVIDSFVVPDTMRTWSRSDTHVAEGALYEGGGRVDGYRFYEKRVRRGNVWYVCAMYYPEAYRRSFDHLFHVIDSWAVFPEKRLRLSHC